LEISKSISRSNFKTIDAERSAAAANAFAGAKCPAALPPYALEAQILSPIDPVRSDRPKLMRDPHFFMAATRPRREWSTDHAA
jgi:hypothetical protein